MCGWSYAIRKHCVWMQICYVEEKSLLLEIMWPRLRVHHYFCLEKGCHEITSHLSVTGNQYVPPPSTPEFSTLLRLVVQRLWLSLSYSSFTSHRGVSQATDMPHPLHPRILHTSEDFLYKGYGCLYHAVRLPHTEVSIALVADEWHRSMLAAGPE